MTALAILVVLGIGISKLNRPEQPVAERRTPSRPVTVTLRDGPSVRLEASHNAGSLEFREQLVRPVACGAVSGLRVTAATEADIETLTEVVQDGICKGLRELTAEPAAGETAEQRVVKAARKGTVIGFAAFERTGEDSTTIASTPPRVAINAKFSNRGKAFKGYLAAVLMHELMHAGADDVTVRAEDEYAARKVEFERCTRLAVEARGRSCADAEEIAGWPVEDALRRLRLVGYP